MDILKHIWSTLREMGRELWNLPRYVANISVRKREQAVLDDQEAERLDRIRNPSKYRGK
jgi:hypothetical protein